MKDFNEKLNLKVIFSIKIKKWKQNGKQKFKFPESLLLFISN